MIKLEFLMSMNRYAPDSERQHSMWDEVASNYTKRHRHYHDLAHLDTMLEHLQFHKQKFENWDVIVFATAYHDLVYNPLKSNNEEASAAIAAARLKDMSFPDHLIGACERFILATKRHEVSDRETNLFTDADLTILGADPAAYETYAKQVRREYWIYPDIVYKPGRRKVLRHFLDMENIYKTSEFSDKYELQARLNIQEELDAL